MRDVINLVNNWLNKGLKVRVNGRLVRYVGRFGGLTVSGEFVPCDVRRIATEIQSRKTRENF